MTDRMTENAPPETPRRLPIVGVMGSGSDDHEDKAAPLGRWLATAHCHLLTGGGRGVMTAVSRAFSGVTERAGRVLGILPGRIDEAGWRPLPGYPNPWVEIPVFTHLPLSGREGQAPMSRNHINVLTADVVVALPGGMGTSSEIRLALRYGRPVVAFVDRRGDIPDLAPEVRAVSDLAGISAFILRHLNRPGPPP